MYDEKFKGLQSEVPSNGDIIELCQSIINNVMRNLHVASLAIVEQVNSDGSYIIRPFPIKEGETFKKITSIKVDGLSIDVNDVVVVLYMDRDFRQNLAQNQNHQTFTPTSNGELHQEKYGIIINKI